MAKLSSSVQSEVSALVDGSSSILVENAALKQQAARLGERVIEAESASLDQVRPPRCDSDGAQTLDAILMGPK